jgi:phosphatidylglycerol:prolipoprotein diacylglycerol transferase
MDPVAFKIFGLEIMWYGIFITSGVLIGAILAIKQGRKVGFKENDLLDVIMIGIPSAIVGARLYYVIFNLEYYRNNLKEVLNIRGGGLAIHGGLLAAFLAGIIFCRIRKAEFWKLADITAPSFVLAQGIGRWGNYVNQEAYGVETSLPWGILIEGSKVHPTFLYESIWNLLVFAFLIWFRQKKQTFDGQIFAYYLILYSFGRFWVEGLRTDSLYFANLRVAQITSVAFIVAGVMIIRAKSRTKY